MDSLRRATGYDLFKANVTILLLILFFLLNRGRATQEPTLISTLSPIPSTTPAQREGAGPLGAKPTTTIVSATSLLLTSTPVATQTSTATRAVVSTLVPLPSPITTNLSTLTVPSVPFPTETNVIGPSATPFPTATAVASSTFTPVPTTPVASACEAAASRSRLQAGTSATILRRLNFRSSPGIHDNWLLTNLPGTRVEVIGGPECIPQFRGVYVWWQIKLPNGQVGWSAEAPQYGSFYFMEPMPCSLQFFQKLHHHLIKVWGM
jgi:hypothetical protein